MTDWSGGIGNKLFEAEVVRTWELDTQKVKLDRIRLRLDTGIAKRDHLIHQGLRPLTLKLSLNVENCCLF